ncbi:MAG: NTP transferase domain-containing protein [Pirellulales bacterium]
MLNTLGIVQPRACSEGASASLSRKLGGKSLLEWAVRQATDCQRLDRVVVAALPGAEAEQIAQLVPSDVAVFVGSRPDRLACFHEALQAHPAHGIVRIVADNPYTDPVLIDRLVRTADEHPTCDYISFCARDGRPAILSSIGVFGEWCGAEALRRAHRDARSTEDRAAVTRYMFSHPEKFSIRLISAPHELQRDGVALTVNCEEDWERAQAMIDVFGADSLNWRRLAAYQD